MHGVTIWAESFAGWNHFLAHDLGLQVVHEGAHTRRYSVPGSGPGAHVVVRVVSDADSGVTALGYVHHTAFRVPDWALDAWRSRLAPYAAGEAEDHVYYRAVPLEGPEGVRLELASDGPGVSVDELPAEMGTRLVLPPWLEARRTDLEQRLAPLRIPGAKNPM